MSVQVKYPTFYVISYWYQQHFNGQLQMINIAKLYVVTMCKCHPLVESSICGSNSQYSMLAFYKEDLALIFIWMIYPICYVSWIIYIWSNLLLIKNMIKIADVYVGITTLNINNWLSYSNKWVFCMISFNIILYETIIVSPYLKEISLINIPLKV